MPRLRLHLQTISGLSLGMLLLTAACGNNTTPVNPNPDLASASPDLAAAPDLATPPDLLPLTLPVPAGCNTAMAVTGMTAYTTIIAANGQRCMGQNCHNNAQAPVFSTRQTFMAAMINKNSTSSYQFVVPNMPDKSYLLYKLRNLQQSVPGGNGSLMPLVGTQLTDAEFCTVYAWVKNGAPVN